MGWRAAMPRDLDLLISTRHKPREDETVLMSWSTWSAADSSAGQPTVPATGGLSPTQGLRPWEERANAEGRRTGRLLVVQAKSR